MTTKPLPLGPLTLPERIRPLRRTDLSVHVVILSRRKVLDMLITASSLMHGGKGLPNVPGGQQVDGYLATLCAYLDAALQTTPAGFIELRGTRDWFEQLLTAAGDMATAIDVGMQMQTE